MPPPAATWSPSWKPGIALLPALPETIIVRERGTSQKQAKGLVQRTADRIADKINDELAGNVQLRDLRDLEVLLVGRGLLARANEVVSLTVDSVTFQEDGTGTVRLRRKKTDTRTYPLGAEAVEALKRWLAAAGIESGPLFRAISKASKVRDGEVRDNAIGVRDVTRAVERLAGKGCSSHSLAGWDGPGPGGRQVRTARHHAGWRLEDSRDGEPLH